MTIGIPPAIDSDIEDVAWALQTAASLWKRNERVDAIVWLRRAAQAAGEAEHDDRALVLAREAAELSDWIAKNPVIAPPDATISSIPPNDSTSGGGVDDLLGIVTIEAAPAVSMSAPTAPLAFMPMPLPQVIAPPAPNTSDLIPISEPSSPVVFQSVASERTGDHVRSAEEAHAGMLDPWSTPTEEEVPAHTSAVPSSSGGGSSSSSVVSSDDYDDEVVTSAQLVIPPPEGAVVIPAPRPPPPRKPPPPVKITPLPPDLAPDPMQEFSQQPTRQEAPTEEVRAAAVPSPSPPRPLTQTMPSPGLGPPVHRFPNEATLVSPVSPGVEPPPQKKELDLTTVDALADLPDDAREELERGATIHRLARDEEVAGFALAFVIDGSVDVAAQIVDVAAQRIDKGHVLKAKGTVAESVPLRLICASENAVVATWDAAQVEPAFKTCPWVEDDLRANANKMQALIGVTLGPLAERLDADLRAQVTGRLELRELAEGDVIVEQGSAVRELCLVGQGAIELVKDGEVVGEVSVGEFLFPSEIMAGGKATATARAAKGGVLLLASDRSVAQELMMTCPPLLEIFAGM